MVRAGKRDAHWREGCLDLDDGRQDPQQPVDNDGQEVDESEGRVVLDGVRTGVL